MSSSADSPAWTVPLAQKCQEHYGWSKPETRRILKGYLEFLKIKKNLQDWKGEILDPPPLIESMWQQHVLASAEYRQDCLEYCGRIVEYDNFGKRSSTAEERRRMTHIAIMSRADITDHDGDLWSFGNASVAQVEETEANITEEDEKNKSVEQERAPRKRAATAEVTAPPPRKLRATRSYKEEEPVSLGLYPIRPVLPSKIHKEVYKLVSAAREEIELARRQDRVCQTLRKSAAESAAYAQAIHDIGGIGFLLDVLDQHSSNKKVVPEAAGALGNVLYHVSQEAEDQVEKLNGIETIVKAMHRTKYDRACQTQCLHALTNAHPEDRDLEQLLKGDAASTILDAMEHIPTNMELQDHGFRFLYNLASDGGKDACEWLLDAKAIDVVSKIIPSITRSKNLTDVLAFHVCGTIHCLAKTNSKQTKAVIRLLVPFLERDFEPEIHVTCINALLCMLCSPMTHCTAPIQNAVAVLLGNQPQVCVQIKALKLVEKIMDEKLELQLRNQCLASILDIIESCEDDDDDECEDDNDGDDFVFALQFLRKLSWDGCEGLTNVVEIILEKLLSSDDEDDDDGEARKTLDYLAETYTDVALLLDENSK